ncbi:unnamed protein product [Lactuca saligna]|uniref:Serine/threonine-protein kinase TOR n=1 Tax=Lactuca saligna TaxID=75948 RepID=A0AA35ZRS1_LACSI|nr:unnamed protein product [Lactuca saligna]
MFRDRLMKLFFSEGDEGKPMLEEASTLGHLDATFVVRMMMMAEGQIEEAGSFIHVERCLPHNKMYMESYNVGSVIKNPRISSHVPTLLLGLTDPNIRTKYSPNILLQVLVDPIPEVRSVATRAVGSLIRGTGKENFPDLIPWFLDTLKYDGSNVERSGATQGLSKVVASLGT